MEYQFVQSGTARIVYHERGSGDPLVLLMGFGADGGVWEKHAAHYEKHFRCILPDNRGVGRSDQPAGSYTTTMMAADTIAVMDHAGISQAQVAGISMGGAIAQELAINYPERVRSLALVSTWARFNNYATVVYQNLKHIRAAVTPDIFMELLQLWLYAPPFYEKYIHELNKAAVEQQEYTQSRNGFEGQLDACIQHNAIDRLHQIKVPVLITVGTMDIFTPPEFSRAIHSKITHSEFSVYPTGGHVHHWEDLKRFNDETLHFFNTNRV